jgi:hypothetical protein
MTPEQLQELLIECFTAAEYSYLEGLEFGEIPEWQDKAAELLAALTESVDSISASTMASTLGHRERLGPTVFNACLTDAIAVVGTASFPKNANEFLNLLNLDLEHRGR